MKKISIGNEDVEDLTQQIKDIILKKTIAGDLEKDITIDIEDFIKLDKEIPKARLIFSTKAYTKMLTYVRESDLEIAWHGIVERIASDEYPAGFYVKDVMCYPQKVTGTTVNTDDEEYAQWINSLDCDTYNSMKIQCHSHVKMSPKPSGTDDSYYKQQLQDTDSDDFYIFLIINKDHKMWYNIYDKLNNIHYEENDIDFTVADADGIDLFKQCSDDIAHYCQKHTYVSEKKNEDKKEDKKESYYNYYDKCNYYYDDYTDYDDEKYLKYYNDYYADYIEKNTTPFISYRDYRNKRLKENKNESKQK